MSDSGSDHGQFVTDKGGIIKVYDLDDVDEFCQLIDGLIEFPSIFDGNDDIDAGHIGFFRVPGVNAFDIDALRLMSRQRGSKRRAYCHRAEPGVVLSLGYTSQYHLVQSFSSGNHRIDIFIRWNEYIK